MADLAPASCSSDDLIYELGAERMRSIVLTKEKAALAAQVAQLTQANTEADIKLSAAMGEIADLKEKIANMGSDNAIPPTVETLAG